jgi:gliding motility-associated-like protein
MFSIGNTGYIVGGGSGTNSYDANQVWAYDQASNSFTQKNNFPRKIADGVGFVINGFAYVGTGVDSNLNYYNDFWQYNPTSDTWTQVASFLGAARYMSMAFALNGKGYVGCGSNGTDFNDFYQYDPVANTWATKSSLPGTARQNGFGIEAGGFGYMGLGYSNTSDFQDAYQYNDSTDTWTQIASFPGTARDGMGSFVIADTFYIVAGGNYSSGNFFSDCWLYNAGSNIWETQEGISCASPPYQNNGGFSLNGYGYVLTGILGGGNYGQTLLQFGPQDNSFIQQVSVLGPDTLYCSNFTRTLNTGNACTLWSTGVVDSQIVVSTQGAYWAIIPTACGLEMDTANIYQGPPSYNVPNDSTVNSCGSFTLIAYGASSILWSNGSNASMLVINDTASFTVSATNTCGTTTDTVTINAYPVPTVNLISSDTSLCSGQELYLVVTDSNSTYFWQDSTTDSTYTVSNSGTYSVTVTTNHGCTATGSIVVNYTEVPFLDLGPQDTTYCGSFARVLTSAFPYTIWSTGDTAMQITVTSPGIYSASVSNMCNAPGTSGVVDSIIIFEAIIPSISTSPVTPICPGDSLLVTASGALHYIWSTGIDTPSILITQPGVYYLQAYDSSKLCSNNDSVVVPRNLPPNFTLGNDTTICGSQGLLLKPSVTFGQYVWQDQSTDSVYFVAESGVYSVTATNNCGSDSSKINVNIYSDDCVLLIPTGFSPNNDGNNDLFRAHCHCPVRQFSISVFNRWGENVYSANDIGGGWDGTYKGVPQAMGVYVYYAEYLNYCSNKIQRVTGSITLVR